MAFITPEFLLTSLIVVIAPGTGTLYTIATGLAAGRGMSFAAAFGCTLGIIPHMLAAITGLAAILHSTPGAFELVKYAGVAWLLYLAWATLTQRGSLNVEGVEQRNPRQVISHAILINLLNPNLPQFIQRGSASPIGEMLILSAVFMLMTLLVFMLYGAFSAAMRGYVLSRPRVLQGLRACFAAGFVGLGIKLILAQR